jgi:hypothetical protein
MNKNYRQPGPRTGTLCPREPVIIGASNPTTYPSSARIELMHTTLPKGKNPNNRERDLEGLYSRIAIEDYSLSWDAGKDRRVLGPRDTAGVRKLRKRVGLWAGGKTQWVGISRIRRGSAVGAKETGVLIGGEEGKKWVVGMTRRSRLGVVECTEENVVVDEDASREKRKMLEKEAVLRSGYQPLKNGL